MSGDPTRDEMIAFLEEQGIDDEFDREEAIYWFASAYHSGQSSSLYEALSLSEYKPGMMQNAPTEDSGAEIAYEMLIAEFAPEDDESEDDESEGDEDDEADEPDDGDDE